ncbi:MAG: hypothetical protein ACOCXT_03460 [Candidatus Dojkabacteria bacterium]
MEIPPPQHPVTHDQNVYSGVPGQNDSKDTMALISLILCLISIPFFFISGCLSFPLVVTALILGYLGLQSTKNRGMAMAGLIISIVLCVLYLILFLCVASFFGLMFISGV